NEFEWERKRHKTCKRCKDHRDRKNKTLTNEITSLDNHELDSQDNFEILPEEDSAGIIITNENSNPELKDYIEVDYLDLGDFIEHEIQELTIDSQIDGVADIPYYTHLVVNLDSATTQNKTAKEIANLNVAEIEGGDDYSWK
ncbi:hypothetical protein C2G38_2150965, partial [Gigaspora rosea]